MQFENKEKFCFFCYENFFFVRSLFQFGLYVKKKYMYIKKKPIRETVKELEIMHFSSLFYSTSWDYLFLNIIRSSSSFYDPRFLFFSGAAAASCEVVSQSVRSE